MGKVDDFSFSSVSKCDCWLIEKSLFSGKKRFTKCNNGNVRNPKHSVQIRSGYVESWGRGISKMTELCIAGGLPKPVYTVEGSDFWVEFRKDMYSAEYLQSLKLNDRQVKAVLYVKENGKITNSEYQKNQRYQKNYCSN